jgi:putative membrane protein
MTKIKTTGCVLAACLSAAMVGCSKDNTSEVAPAASQGDEVTPAERSVNDDATTLTEGQSLQILDTVDSGEIAQGQLAVTKASAQSVRDFANDMIEQHSRAKQEGAQYAQQNNITPAPSKLSNKLENHGADVLHKLQTQEGADFDAAYMKAQVEQHQEVLKKLDNRLIPSASARARTHLETAREMVHHHLVKAKEIQASLTR